MRKASGYVRLMRPVNCLMMGFAVIVGAALADADALATSWLRLVYGFLTGFLLTAASMVMNDYFDRDIDAVNEPSRPIPSGTIRPKHALVFASAMTFFAFSRSITFLINLWVLGSPDSIPKQSL